MTSQFRRFALGRGSSNASAYRRRTITRTFISTWANGRRSAAPTARPGSASIHDWGHLKPIRPIAYTSDAPAASNGRSPVQGLASSRRLEREAGRNVEVMWLLRRLVPDDKVIADFRKDNSERGPCDEDGASEGEACQAHAGDGQARRHRGADAGLARSAGVANRSRQSINGNQWPRLRRRWLQCAGCGGHGASSDCRP